MSELGEYLDPKIFKRASPAKGEMDARDNFKEAIDTEQSVGRWVE
jgi:hypothetical protein